MKTLLQAISSDKNLYEICRRFAILAEEGKTKEELNEIIQILKLPLRYHLFITANFSEIVGLKYIHGDSKYSINI